MEITMAMVVLVIVPLVGLLLWWWNDLRFGLVKLRCSASGATLPPGHMGIPFIGELLSFLWYFKVVRRPNDYINSKRRKYGAGIGMYRTYLFGVPSIIACSRSATKFVYQSDTKFSQEWPTAKILGSTAMVNVQGAAHMRIKGFVSRAINQPDALRRISLLVQPRVISALQSWAHKGRIIAFKEAEKVTFEIIGKYFASIEPGPVLDTLDELFKGVDFRHRQRDPAVEWRQIIDRRSGSGKAVSRRELDKRKNYQDGIETTNDLIDGLMQLKDDEGKGLRDIEVLDNVISLVAGGYESVTISVTWALYYLAKYPKVLDKLRV
ncbi:hypothetical protein RJ640_005362 [Escallonia rubra]|uniref:Cytochrome P450 n=1 Tax=Escallonia rubra TaxID=112253 RepID=A0AA88S7B2_9ASTE|nr:hypothetical protein RJ640_005362 [Escallonia rubra]